MKRGPFGDAGGDGETPSDEIKRGPRPQLLRPAPSVAGHRGHKNDSLGGRHGYFSATAPSRRSLRAIDAGGVSRLGPR